MNKILQITYPCTVYQNFVKFALPLTFYNYLYLNKINIKKQVLNNKYLFVKLFIFKQTFNFI